MPVIVDVPAPIVAALPSGRTVALGLLGFNADDLGVRLAGVRLQGWDGSAASSLQLAQKLRAPGGWRSSQPQFVPRSLNLTGMIVGPNAASVVNACDALNAAVSLDETTLTVDGDDVGPRTMRVSRQGEVLIEGTPTQTVKTFSIGLVAADPRKFGATLTLTTPLPSSTGGITVPLTVPFAINSTVFTGQVSMLNPGNHVGPVVARISGPAPQGGIITHTSSAGTSVFALGLPLGDGEFVDIDMENETVLAQGQAASRTQWITMRGFSGFDPGENTWSFTAPVASAATLTITATPSWS